MTIVRVSSKLVSIQEGVIPVLLSRHSSAQTLGSRKKNGVMKVASFSCHPSSQHWDPDWALSW
ncbi:hypothetical protein [Wolbachia endosymbiont (group B) of Limnophora tigrina]|uniref:hypothetical protein n=1 Tax=Wolbachia endosymbiont (group B) of Limnophora tigrina TaxID=3139317 RepID=UPI0035B52FDA